MLTIREATPADIPLILAYIAELADYERAPEKAVARAEDLQRYMFGPQPLIFCELARWDGEDAGFALYFFNFSTPHTIKNKELFNGSRMYCSIPFNNCKLCRFI